jgi:hypothetical protein
MEVSAGVPLSDDCEGTLVCAYLLAFGGFCLHVPMMGSLQVHLGPDFPFLEDRSCIELGSP